MTNALGIAAVSVVLRSLLENGLVEQDVAAFTGGDTMVTVQPPQRVKTGGDERAQINLFLYQVAPRGLSTASRFPSRERVATVNASDEGGDPRDEQHVVELSYLISAYGLQDFQVELLLGAAEHLLRQNPLLITPQIKKALDSAAAASGMGSPIPAAMAQSDVVARIKSIHLTQLALSLAELQHLWSMLQAPFRASLCYKAVVTLRQYAPAEESAAL